jgi:hypothetical protein
MLTNTKVLQSKKLRTDVKESSPKANNFTPEQIASFMRIQIEALTTRYQEQLTWTISNYQDWFKSLHPSHNMLSVHDYAILNNIPIDIPLSSKIGIKAKSLSKRMGYNVESFPDPLFGKINTYHSEILDTIFREVI